MFYYHTHNLGIVFNILMRHLPVDKDSIDYSVNWGISTPFNTNYTCTTTVQPLDKR